VRLERLGQLENPMTSSGIEESVNIWIYKSTKRGYPSHISLYVKENTMFEALKNHSSMTDYYLRIGR
jgi:hypothetical protein